jgi:hypothetical protein
MAARALVVNAIRLAPASSMTQLLTRLLAL